MTDHSRILCKNPVLKALNYVKGWIRTSTSNLSITPYQGKLVSQSKCEIQPIKTFQGTNSCYHKSASSIWIKLFFTSCTDKKGRYNLKTSQLEHNESSDKISEITDISSFDNIYKAKHYGVQLQT